MIAIMSDTVAAFVLSRQDAAHQLEPGQSLFREGDSVRRAYVVLEGEMKLVRYGVSGAELILHRVGSDTLLAEASCFSDRYHCTAVAISACRLASVGRSVLFSDDAAAPFLFSLARDLSREIQRSRARCEILALKTVDDRLDAWLALNDGAMPARGGWALLAAELAVSPEALYRTLAARRKTPGRSVVSGPDAGIAIHPARPAR